MHHALDEFKCFISISTSYYDHYTTEKKKHRNSNTTRAHSILPLPLPVKFFSEIPCLLIQIEQTTNLNR